MAVNSQLTLISGNYGGIKVFCTPRSYPIFQQLTLKSRSLNHWAGLIVRGLRGLSCGIINNDDVFVTPLNMHQGVQDFLINLPGCKVYAQRRDNGTYVISMIEPASDYKQEQKDYKRPGLHRATKPSRDWVTVLKEDGRVESKNDTNIVAISDTGYKNPAASARRVGPRAKIVSSSVENTGLDLFFTPGKGRIGGLINYRQSINAASHNSLNEPAILLANIMKNARKTKNVVWFSDMGGSGILTQAMGMLAKQGIKLEGHKLFLHRPRTRKDAALELSQQLGMTLDRDFTKSNNLNINELVGASSLSLSFKRKKLDSEYKTTEMMQDLYRGVTGGHGVWKTAAALSAAAVAATAFAPVASVVGAMGAAATAAKLAGAAAPIVAANMPDTVDAFKSRISR